MNFEVTFGLTVVEGDWQHFVRTNDQQLYVGLLTGSDRRFGLISFHVYPYEDVQQAVQNMKRNLDLIGLGNRQLGNSELTTMLWMDRAPSDPIRMIELSGITANDGALHMAWAD